jgi:hypothetical protein
VLVDAGQPTYVGGMFGPDRYQHRPMQSGWHSVPAPWGLEQRAGAQGAARATFTPADAGPTLSLDLAAAYELPAASRLEREFHFDAASGTLTIDDRWDVGAVEAPATGAMLVRVLACGDVAIDGSGATVRAQDGSRVRIGLDGDDFTVSVDAWMLDDPLLHQVWGASLTRITIAIESGRDGRLTGRLRSTIAPEPAPGA